MRRSAAEFPPRQLPPTTRRRSLTLSFPVADEEIVQEIQVGGLDRSARDAQLHHGHSRSYTLNQKVYSISISFCNIILKIIESFKNCSSFNRWRGPRKTRLYLYRIRQYVVHGNRHARLLSHSLLPRYSIRPPHRSAFSR